MEGFVFVNKPLIRVFIFLNLCSLSFTFPFVGFILTSLEKTLLLFNLVTVPGSMFIVINFWDFFHFMTWVSKISLMTYLQVLNCAKYLKGLFGRPLNDGEQWWYSGDSTCPHQGGPGSIPRLGVICGLSLMVLFSALRGFPQGTPVLPSPQKPTFD